LPIDSSLVASFFLEVPHPGAGRHLEPPAPEPGGRPAPSVGGHLLIHLDERPPPRHSDEAQRHGTQTQPDEPPPERGHHVILSLRQGGGEDLNLSAIKTDTFV